MILLGIINMNKTKIIQIGIYQTNSGSNFPITMVTIINNNELKCHIQMGDWKTYSAVEIRKYVCDIKFHETCSIEKLYTLLNIWEIYNNYHNSYASPKQLFILQNKSKTTEMTHLMKKHFLNDMNILTDGGYMFGQLRKNEVPAHILKYIEDYPNVSCFY